jgi:hypothetical protein
MHLLLFITLFITSIASFNLNAYVSEPAPREEDESDVMNWLAHQGFHDLKEESWMFMDTTYISSWKESFPALYINLNGSTNSLLPSDRLVLQSRGLLFALVYCRLQTYRKSSLQCRPWISQCLCHKMTF